MMGRQLLLWFLIVLLNTNFFVTVNANPLNNKKQLLRLAKESLKKGKARSLYSKESVLSPLIYDREPTCDQLRAMWRLSRRQSRATILTNELPKYQDPFFANSGLRNEYRRASASPIYGRMITHSNLWTDNPLNRPNFVKMIHDKLRYSKPRINSNLYQTTLRNDGGGFGTLIGSVDESQENLYENSNGRFDQLRKAMYEEKMKELESTRGRGYHPIMEGNTKAFGRVLVSPEQRFRTTKTIRSGAQSEDILEKRILDALRKGMRSNGSRNEGDIFLLNDEDVPEVWKVSRTILAWLYHCHYPRFLKLTSRVLRGQI